MNAPDKAARTKATRSTEQQESLEAPGSGNSLAGKPGVKPSKPARAPKSVDPGKQGGPGSPGKRNAGEKRARLNESLRLELQALRSALNQILEGYEVKVGGLIAELLDRLEGDPALDQPPRPLTVAQAQAALDELTAVSIRPDQARLKDLRRIRRVVRRLRDRIPD